MARAHETGTGLWRMLAPPTIWAAHFLAVYVGAAVYCAKAGRDVAAGPIAIIVVAATIVALVAIGLVVVSTARRWGVSLIDGDLRYDRPHAEERHRFLSHMTLMLSGLSAVAVIYVALPALFMEACW